MKKGPAHTRVRTTCAWDRFLVIAMGGLALGSPHALALDPALPEQSFDSSRYEGIWTKSPFAVASPDQPQASAQYQLVGIARIDDVSYASLIDSQNGGKHFLLFSHQPRQGLQLISVELSHGASPGRAILQKDGQELSLEMAPRAGGLPGQPPGASPFSASDSASNAPNQAPLTNVPTLTPPTGGTLPLIFQNVDTSRIHLTADQVATINQLRQDFTKAISSPAPSNSSSNTVSSQSVATASSQDNSAPAQSPQLHTWETAQQQTDERLEALLGYDAFSQYQMALAKSATP